VQFGGALVTPVAGSTLCPKLKLCGEMKKSPKFLDFCIIFEIHVLASILHNQVGPRVGR